MFGLFASQLHRIHNHNSSPAAPMFAHKTMEMKKIHRIVKAVNPVNPAHYAHYLLLLLLYYNLNIQRCVCALCISILFDSIICFHFYSNRVAGCSDFGLAVGAIASNVWQNDEVVPGQRNARCGAHIRYAAPLARARLSTNKQRLLHAVIIRNKRSISRCVCVCAHGHTNKTREKCVVAREQIVTYTQHPTLDHMLNGNVSSHFGGYKFRYLGSCFRVFFGCYCFRREKEKEN